MSFKTVLVYFNLAQREEGLLQAVVPLAQAHRAHIVGVTVIPPLSSYAALAGEYSEGLVDAELSASRERAELLAAEFDEAVREHDLEATWRCLEAGPQGVAHAVVELAAGCDLVVARPSEPDSEWELTSARAERILMEGRRPTVLMPQSYQGALTARRVLIGWNGRAEAARATFDALPFLQKAERVEIVTLEEEEPETHTHLSESSDIVKALARHGVEAAVLAPPADSGSEGETLLNLAGERGAELLVIGAYGHSRMSEFMFGGMTRHVLRNMTLPVFMSH